MSVSAESVHVFVYLKIIPQTSGLHVTTQASMIYLLKPKKKGKKKKFRLCDASSQIRNMHLDLFLFDSELLQVRPVCLSEGCRLQA